MSPVQRMAQPVLSCHIEASWRPKHLMLKKRSEVDGRKASNREDGVSGSSWVLKECCDGARPLGMMCGGYGKGM